MTRTEVMQFTWRMSLIMYRRKRSQLFALRRHWGNAVQPGTNIIMTAATSSQAIKCRLFTSSPNSSDNPRVDNALDPPARPKSGRPSRQETILSAY
ncbi:hypothetical protein NPIL_613521 [Nephila pilipes]|uniref:Uncharacterized protein n=1 Tax=Nephila pilipes TaxID=299642 RepID=A0A8X6UKT3_NEPPI|nr:hypothetical protein NPIL_613521 [Nephila pilipes]